MQDHELMRMAAFKLQDTARRMTSLAREAETPHAEAQLKRLADAVCEMETELWAVLEAEMSDTVARGERDAARDRRTRRGVGR